MRIRPVDALPPLPRRGRPSPYQSLYQQLNESGPDQWIQVSCDDSEAFRRLLANLRTHTTPRIRTRTDITNLVIYAQRR